ncbi:ATP-binding protein [Lysinibacillus sp. CTST325]
MVKYSGEGIPENVLPHIFKPLYRGEYSRNRQTGGSGLGLITMHIFVFLCQTRLMYLRKERCLVILSRRQGD